MTIDALYGWGYGLGMETSLDWKPIPSFPFYEMDADGRIRSWALYNAADPTKPLRRASPKVLAPRSDGCANLYREMADGALRRCWLGVRRLAAIRKRLWDQ